jgi:hypothetical protein
VIRSIKEIAGNIQNIPQEVLGQLEAMQDVIQVEILYT